MKGYGVVGFSLVVLGFAVIGCGKPPSKLVGTWQSNIGGTITNYHFRPDYTYSMDLSMASWKVSVEGSYDIDGKNLIMRPETVTSDGPEPRASELKKQANQQATIEFVRTAPDTFKLMPGVPAEVTVNRISEIP